MRLNIMDVDLNYVRYGKEGAESIVFLHGWGQNIDMMKPIGDRFKGDYDIIIFDLPGFGKSSEPKEFFSCYDYVNLIHQSLVELNVKKPIIVGHSLGGKLGLLYASMYDVSKLVCFAGPFCKEIKKQSLKVKALKTLKKVPGLNKFEEFAKKHMGSRDYRNASGVMRDILVGHVNLDITDEVKKIKCPTLLIWGTEDAEVSIERGYELEQLISNCGIVVYEGCTHYAYLERLGQTINVLKSFFGG